MSNSAFLRFSIVPPKFLNGCLLGNFWCCIEIFGLCGGHKNVDKGIKACRHTNFDFVLLVISTQLGNTKPNHLICIQYQFCLPVGNTSYVFVAKRWNPTLFVEKNLDYALRAKTLANLRSEPTPHFMRFMRFVQYGLLRVRNPLTVWYLILATGGILVLALVVYTVWGHLDKKCP